MMQGAWQRGVCTDPCVACSPSAATLCLTAHASPVSYMYDHDIVRACIDTYTYSVYVEST